MSDSFHKFYICEEEQEGEESEEGERVVLPEEKAPSVFGAFFPNKGVPKKAPKIDPRFELFLGPKIP